jgi:hypothetical protein
VGENGEPRPCTGVGVVCRRGGGHGGKAGELMFPGFRLSGVVAVTPVRGHYERPPPAFTCVQFQLLLPFCSVAVSLSRANGREVKVHRVTDPYNFFEKDRPAVLILSVYDQNIKYTPSQTNKMIR